MPSSASRAGGAILVALTVALAAIVPQAPVSAATPWVGIVAPLWDSPGALVPVIVTLTHPPRGATVTLSGHGTRGATMTCTGPQWRNPIRDTISRTCYVQLPLTGERFPLRGTATIVRPGRAPQIVTGHGDRALKAIGPPSRTPLTIDDARSIERCGHTTRDVWLTFDDGASPDGLRSILRTLRVNGVRGRFFFTGRWASVHPDLLRVIRTEGHLLANHTADHAALTKVGWREVLRQIAGGVTPTTRPALLRPPFGAGAFTSRLVSLAASAGQSVCRWTMDTWDWDGSSASVIVERVRHGDRLSPPAAAGGVILMHGYGAHTAQALQGVIDAVRAKGLTLDRLPR